MADFKQLVNTKQSHLSGDSVNYYLQELKNGTLVEVDDINMVLRISFFEGTSFKSLHRLCKLRTGLGKPGSTPEYEAGKVLYYNKLTDVESQRLRKKGFIFSFDEAMAIDNYIVQVPEPKRLNPYEFRIGDYINSLNPSDLERDIFRNIFFVVVSRLIDETINPVATAASLANVHLAHELVAQVRAGAYDNLV